MRLGVVFAGGQARRFGTDKALAVIDGEPMLARVLARLRPQVDALAVIGRRWPGCDMIEDRPPGGHGPLAALAGGLAHAAAQGYAELLTSGCDLPDLPLDLVDRLAPAPAVVAGQPLLGLWPAALGPALERYLHSTDRRAMRGWIAVIGAREIPFPGALANINEPADLTAYLTSADRRSSR